MNLIGLEMDCNPLTSLACQQTGHPNAIYTEYAEKLHAVAYQAAAVVNHQEKMELGQHANTIVHDIPALADC
jgi:predicted ATP-grasp superfamily ATP-dependent carboligase